MVGNAVNVSRLNRDLSLQRHGQYESFWKNRPATFPIAHFKEHPKIYFEIGAGTGWFFLELARRDPGTFFVAVERDRMRGNRLMHRAKKAELTNVAAYRGNAIPALLHGEIPNESVDRIYMMYPCPWPKTAHRKNRWYLHPIMPHLHRILKKDGLIVWASDQKFYIDEAHFVCTQKYGLTSLAHGELSPNEFNSLADFPAGRTKFEANFLRQSLPCYELIVRKS